MAISRPFLLALIGAVLAGATFFAVQSSRDSADDAAAPAAQQSAPEQPAAAPAESTPAASPEELLQSAFNASAIDSTAFDASFSLVSGGTRFELDLTGAFEQGAANDVPELALDATVGVAGERIRGGFTSVGDKAYFTRGETGWQVPAQVWDPLVEAVASRDAGAQTAPQLQLAVDPRKWLRDVKSEGEEMVGSVETTHVSATIDAEVLAEELVGLARQSGADAPDALRVARTVKEAEVDVWVGADDQLLRRLSTEVLSRRGQILFDLSLTGVNEPQSIEAPADVRPGMPGGVFGAFAQGFTGGLSGLGGGQPMSLAALTSPNPQRAARAVKAGKKVLILFHNPKGLDDRLMRRVVRAVDARTQAVVLSDHVDAVDRYGKLVEDLGVSQTPSIVLIDSAGDARLFEGYADTDTLAQAVADAR